MSKKYFGVIRYRKVSESKSPSIYSIEFNDQEGYQRWLSLRESNTLQEVYDVYVKTDISSPEEIQQIRDNLYNFLIEYQEKYNNAVKLYLYGENASNGFPIKETDVTDSLTELENTLVKLKEEYDEKVLKYIESEYNKFKL